MKFTSRRAALTCGVATTALMLGTNAWAADVPPAAMPAPEEVLVTGSLIHGAEAVGVPVQAFSMQDFQDTGATTPADLLRTVPSLQVTSSESTTSGGGNAERNTSVDIRNLNGNTPRTLMMIDGMRFPLQNHGTDSYDPSIIPSIALERIDLLVDGASATYGSDAVAGVINLILRRGFDGAITQAQIGAVDGGNFRYQFQQLYGKTWDGGDLTVAYEYAHQDALHGAGRDYVTYNFVPYGFNDTTPVRSAIPGIVSIGAPNGATGNTCTNCFSVPRGQNGSALTWNNLLANPGTGNEINPYSTGDLLAASQTNRATVTFDQRILPWLEFFGEGFYSNRRVQIRYSSSISPYSTANELTFAVPVGNQFYPIGAPSGIRVSYNFGDEVDPRNSSGEVSDRYQVGFNLELPFDWKGKVFYAANSEHNRAIAGGLVNANAVSAALGAVIPAQGGYASYIKPASVPYLNLFCDPTAFTCNDPTTLSYITGYRDYDETYIINQWGFTADGGVFPLPGGELRLAVGANYETDRYNFTTRQTYNQPATSTVNIVPDPEGRDIWAVFGELNVPIFGDANAIPFFKKLQVEASWRLDNYSDAGRTTNPKIAVDWEPVDGLTIRGSWGTNFRAPAFGDVSATAGKQIQPVNIAAGDTTNATPTCTTGQSAAHGSAAEILNPTCDPSKQYLAGITARGGAGGLAGVTRPDGYVLTPETAATYSVGFDFTPHDFLSGLNLHATYFNIEISNTLATVSLTNGLNDPNLRQFYLLPGDPGFANAVDKLIHDPRSTVSLSQQTTIMFVSDQGVRNEGSMKDDGIDFGGSFNWDMGNWGTWDVGTEGTFFLHRISNNIPGSPDLDDIVGANAAAGIGNTTTSRLKMRSRIGWSKDGYNVTAFANYQSHYFTTEQSPPQCYISGPVCFPGAPQFPNYSNVIPSFYTFDVSVGYNTMDNPANEYLKNLNFQLAIRNVFDRDPPFAYKTSTTGGTIAFAGGNFNPLGRVLSFTITKNW